MILNSNLHYQIFKFVIDNSDISLNCLQHIQKRRNFDAKVTCHQPICLLLHAILSGVGVAAVASYTCVRPWSAGHNMRTCVSYFVHPKFSSLDPLFSFNWSVP